jgi:hypothetical protein
MDVKHHATILYFGVVNERIRDMDKPQETKYLMSYKKAMDWLGNGNTLVGSAFAQCGSELRVFAFGTAAEKPHLIGSAAIGSVSCAAEKKDLASH